MAENLFILPPFRIPLVGGRTGTSIETYHARLTPFRWPATITPDSPLAPVHDTNGVVFPFSPSISEGRNVNYNSIQLTHANEGINAYSNTQSVEITLSDCVWTCDTFDNAIYAMSVLHFFRTFSLMDTGIGKTGRPPSPMWFSAYGKMIFDRVPVLMRSASWSFPNDVDYVSVPNPGTTDFIDKVLRTGRVTGEYTWMPVEFVVNSISLIVQHAPRFWQREFDLASFANGDFLF